jgi:hypothetical protein
MIVTTARGRCLGTGLLTSVLLSIAAIGCGSTADQASPPTPSSGTTTGSSGRGTLPGLSNPGAIPVIHRADHLQRSHFALMRGKAEGLPFRLARSLPSGGGIGANWTLAQRLPTNNPQVWAVPGRGYLCLVDRSARGTIGQSCTRTRQALKLATYIATVPVAHGKKAPSGKRVIIGLAPDGVREVRIHMTGSPPQSAHVAQNVFVVRDKRTTAPAFVEFVRSG